MLSKYQYVTISLVLSIYLRVFRFIYFSLFTFIYLNLFTSIQLSNSVILQLVILLAEIYTGAYKIAFGILKYPTNYSLG